MVKNCFNQKLWQFQCATVNYFIYILYKSFILSIKILIEFSEGIITSAPFFIIQKGNFFIRSVTVHVTRSLIHPISEFSYWKTIEQRSLNRTKNTCSIPIRVCWNWWADLWVLILWNPEIHEIRWQDRLTPILHIFSDIKINTIVVIISLTQK